MNGRPVWILLATGMLVCTSWADSHTAMRATRSDQGILIRENGRPVLFYQRATKSLDGRHPRANYIHPLYGLDGRVLTEDFPSDHRHHRGIFWTWHQVRVDGKKLGDPWTTQDFAWEVVAADVEDTGSAIDLKTRVLWKSSQSLDAQGSAVPLVEERATVRVHPVRKNRRMVDFAIQLRALVDNLTLGGSEDAKGYGGFSTRLILPEDLRFFAEQGEVKPQSTSIEPSRWMHLSGAFGVDGGKGSVTILCHPTTPGFPQRWILRKQRSMQNPVFPGRHAVGLSRDPGMVLRYRLVVQRGAVDLATVRGWQEQYEADETLR